jgi:hypothetical protein
MKHPDRGRHIQLAAQAALGAQAGSDSGTISAGRFRLRYQIEGTALTLPEADP